jgi:hypothetical protein
VIVVITYDLVQFQKILIQLLCFWSITKQCAPPLTNTNTSMTAIHWRTLRPQFVSELHQPSDHRLSAKIVQYICNILNRKKNHKLNMCMATAHYKYAENKINILTSVNFLVLCSVVKSTFLYCIPRKCFIFFTAYFTQLAINFLANYLKDNGS